MNRVAENLAFDDSFRNFTLVHGHRNVAPARQFPPVPEQPDVCISGTVPGLFPTGIRLHSGELFVTFHSPQHMNSADGKNYAARSADGGRTWDLRHKLCLCDNQELLGGDFAYPWAMRADAERGLVVYYAGTRVLGSFLDRRFLRDAAAGLELACCGCLEHRATLAHWSFVEPDGAIAADAVGPNYGRIAGAERGPGRIGAGLHFDGQHDFVWVHDADALRVPRGFAVECRFRAVDVQREQVLLRKGDGPVYRLAIREGKLVFQVGDAAAVSTAELEPECWYHVVALCTTTPDNYEKGILYVNGELDSVHKLAVTLQAGTRANADQRRDRRPLHGPDYQAENEGYMDVGEAGTELPSPTLARRALIMGADMDGEGATGCHFGGALDEVAVHGAALAPDEIADSCRYGYRRAGEVVSETIRRRAEERWGVLNADLHVPEGTNCEIDVLDAGGAVLADAVSLPADLTALDVEAIRLRARLTSADGSRSPRLRRWWVTRP